MKKYWDELFQKREEKFPHEKVLEDNLALFQGKSIVELGAGDGRNSLYLAEKGFNITAIDYSTIAINKINFLNPRINTKVMDVEKEKISLEEFNMVLFIHYFPNYTKLIELMESSREGTVFFIYTFIREEVMGNKKMIAISYEEIEKIKKNLDILSLELEEDNRGKLVYVLIKK